MGNNQNALEKLVKRCVEGLGYEFVGVVKWHHAGSGTWRIYVDKPGGITLSDCVRINNQLEGLLLVEDPLSSQVALEVSSPGLDRPLFTPEQYVRVMGQEIKVYLIAPKEGRRTYKGQLTLVTEEGIQLKETQGEYKVSFFEIKKAHVVGKL